MSGALFAPGFKTTPYWWEASPRPPAEDAPPPAKVDAAVVGSGYTGLHAALRIARGGRSVLVLDAEDAGWGCSSRNGGQIGESVKPDFAALSRRHGAEVARRILRDDREALAFVGRFVAEEGIDCDHRVVGRFHAAHSPAAYRALARELESRPEGFDEPAHLVPRDRQREEIGTDAYHGGAVYEAHASVDPGRYHAGLLARAKEAGVVVAARTKVETMTREADGFTLRTTRGAVRARDVALATNGYTGALSPWQRRRVIPIGSYMIATEELPEGMMERLIPRDRVVSDTRRVVYYYRASPDRRRMLFGGRVSASETDPRASASRLHAAMSALFPELREARISHSWMGFVAYTFDELAHTGTHEGVHYAMGYCGSGVGMASWLGMKMGARVLGAEDGETGLAETRFPTRPFYSGRPWFLPAAVRIKKLQDALGV